MKMTVISALLTWAIVHPYLTTGLVIGGGAAVLQLGEKGLNLLAGAVDHAIDRGYSFDSPHASVRSKP